jgi:hypothetical protein
MAGAGQGSGIALRGGSAEGDGPWRVLVSQVPRCPVSEDSGQDNPPSRGVSQVPNAYRAGAYTPREALRHEPSSTSAVRAR